MPLSKIPIPIPPVSTDPKYKEDIEDTVDWLEDLFEDHSFEEEVFKGYGHPIVYASYEKDPSLETCLVYGHYDVQPAQKSDGWDSDPFELTENDGKYVGRGIVDNKGQVLVHMHSVFELIKEGKLNYNVKFLIEGDEETGGMGIGILLKDKKELFAADCVMISDGEMPYRPVLTASFRGTFNATVAYKTADNNLHSGLYGGAVPNAAEELSRLIAKMHDEDMVSRVDGFYDDDRKLGRKEEKQCKEMDCRSKFIQLTYRAKWANCAVIIALSRHLLL